MCIRDRVGDENVKGVLCVCRTVEDVKLKFRPGMILVVPHTLSLIHI